MVKIKTKSKSKATSECTGLLKPVDISNDLCAFLEIPYGSKIARCEVTKQIAKYIKDNNLQNPENKRQILPDNKLNELLKPSSGFILTYFNIQTLLKPHYTNSPKE